MIVIDTKGHSHELPEDAPVRDHLGKLKLLKACASGDDISFFQGGWVAGMVHSTRQYKFIIDIVSVEEEKEVHAAISKALHAIRDSHDSSVQYFKIIPPSKQ